MNKIAKPRFERFSVAGSFHAAFFGIALLGLAACSADAQESGAPAQPPSPSPSSSDDLVKRGEYLTHAADCQPCHTKPGGTPFAGGRALKLPGGTLYSPNITPSKNGGIGDWSDDQFVGAMQKGIDDAGNHMYPAMPYTSYAKMSRDDVLAIKAYLFSIPPVDGGRPRADISFPFSQRWAIRFWNALFFDNKPFKPDNSKSAEWNRGAYLVDALGHCGECHTPRNMFMAVETSKALGGGEAEGWVAYNITSDRTSGIGGWSDDELMRYLSTGAVPGKGFANGPMGEAIEASLRYLTDDDKKAIVAYLRTVPAVASNADKPRYASGTPNQTALNASEKDGEPSGARLYAYYCASCHGGADRPVAPQYTAMTNESTVGAGSPNNIVMVILQGTHRVDDPKVRMPAYINSFTDDQVAALANYLTARYGNTNAKVSAGDVKTLRTQAAMSLPVGAPSVP
jgi:mono/diheme cytochrome c family protein